MSSTDMEFEYLGPYHVERVLGRGGMGTVYLGKHAKSGDDVALKVIASSLADEERFRRRFAAEVETLKRLKHPNIVQLIGYGEEQGHLFYSMEYVAGENLAEQLKKHGPVPWDRGLEIAIEVCSALKHAHDLGIIHRDLKPANVMINQVGQTKLTDFGIAKLFGSSEVTVAGSVLGTADYMPPEQAEGKPVTIRSDLYALGALLFAMISGRSPHAAKSVPEVLYNVRYTVPPPLDSLNPETPAELAELVTELLSKDASQRPPTALVVSNRLLSLRIGLQHRQLRAQQTAVEVAGDIDEYTSIDLGTEADGDDPASRATAQTQIVPPSAEAHRTNGTGRVKRPVHDGLTQEASVHEEIDSSFIEEPSPGGTTRFTEVDDRERARTTFSHRTDEEPAVIHHWLSVAGLVALIGLCLFTIVYFTRSPSAESLYLSIMEAVESGSEEQLLEAEPILADFERLYPEDPRLRDLAPIRREIEEQKTWRRLQRRAKSGGNDDELDPLEQAFLDCRRLEGVDPSEAQRKWEAFLLVFDRSAPGNLRHRVLIDQAKDHLDSLARRAADQTHPVAAQLSAQIQEAESRLKGEELRKFHEAIIELYRDKPWAKQIVGRLQGKMDSPQ